MTPTIKGEMRPVATLTIEESLVDILKIRRQHQGLTQEDLAKKLGLSAMGLSYLERGSRNLKLSTLTQWAKELGLKIELKLLEAKE